MTKPAEFTASELAARISARVVGDGRAAIRSVASLETASEGEIAYVEDEKFFEAAKNSQASCLIVPVGAAIDSACRIEVENPKLAFAMIARILHPPKMRERNIHPTASIAANAEIALEVFIGPFVC